ncbi:MAG: glycosyltransferase family 1 protein [Rhizobiaceae bacterium]|jgi:glycosyltransferase involved in cell wall biosynthesis|nr:glycosyltransferase family 1 protein [Rhizobiaceae bacterium]
MRVIIATDAWHPQVNGVVRVMETTAREMRALGHEVLIVSPADFRSVAAPGYPEVRLALASARAFGCIADQFRPDAIHIPVEGPVGLAARRWCIRNRFAFTSSYHTRFGDFFAHRTGLDERYATAWQRWFHAPSAAFMVQTPRLERELAEQGFRNIVAWTRGVDTALFKPWRDEPGFDADFLGLPRPVFMVLGRVSLEKNLDAFLGLGLPGSKVVVGGGPHLDLYRARYPAVHFTGPKHGDDVAKHLSAADVFVFPSRFETYGLVVMEALACGTPVAAFPVRGPADIIGNADIGVLSEDLREAALQALSIDRAKARAFALPHSWRAATQQFLSHLVPLADREPHVSASFAISRASA